MLESFLVQGIIIGIVFGVPAGVIGALTIQRTIAYGPAAGLATGMGSTAADCIYAVVSACGITLISGFLTTYQRSITIAGGFLITVFGVMIIRKKTQVKPKASESGVAGSFLSSFVLALTNPAAILSYIIAFSTFGITGKLAAKDAALLVIGIFVGTCIWWGIITGLAYKFRARMTDKIFRTLNYMLGSFIILFGVTAVIRGV